MPKRVSKVMQSGNDPAASATPPPPDCTPSPFSSTRTACWKSLLRFVSPAHLANFDAFMAQNDAFSKQDILRLHKRFQALDTNNNGLVECAEIQSIPGLESNPLVGRLVEIFDGDQNGSIDFAEFVTALAIFTAKGSEEAKLKMLFDLYDLDSDGFISNGELFTLLQVMTGAEFNEVALQVRYPLLYFALLLTCRSKLSTRP